MEETTKKAARTIAQGDAALPSAKHSTPASGTSYQPLSEEERTRVLRGFLAAVKAGAVKLQPDSPLVPLPENPDDPQANTADSQPISQTPQRS